MKKLKLLLTRDFNQWSNQMPRDIIVNTFPKLFGVGISDQIIIFDGKSFGWHRFANDIEKLKLGIIKLPLTHPVFRLSTHQMFRNDVRKLRKMMQVEPHTIMDSPTFYSEFKNLFTKLYPYYAISMFLPGPWADDFIKKHGAKGRRIIKIAFDSRIRSEGLNKEVTNFMREWLGAELAKSGLAADYIKLMSVEEIEEYIYNGKLPKKDILKKRSSGFVSIGNKIYPTRFPSKFLSKHGINLIVEEVRDGQITGQPAYIGKIVRGPVFKILNSNDISKFRPGSVLVTHMTSPDYLIVMKKAKAIVTDEGGVTSHAAITARELGKPCIIGTKFATSIFKDGEIVEVDSGNGIVRKVK